MRLAVISACADDDALLETAVSLAFRTLEADEVIYLGDDDAILRINAAPSAKAQTYVERVLDLAVRGSPEQIRTFCREEPPLLQLHRLPAPPAHAMELLDDQVVLLVRDLSALDDDDRENAAIVVYPAGASPSLGKNGRGYTFTPGALAKGRGGVGLLASTSDGFLAEAYEPDGKRVLQERLELRAGPTLLVAGS